MDRRDLARRLEATVLGSDRPIDMDEWWASDKGAGHCLTAADLTRLRIAAAGLRDEGGRLHRERAAYEADKRLARINRR